MIDGVSYPTAAVYDALGRVWKAQDASGRWAKTQFTARGHALAVCYSTAADVDPACPNSINTYLRTLETDAWGHVLKERRGNIAAMDVTREHWTESGRAKRICAGNAASCELMDELYGWDDAGNLSTQVKESRYQENFTYDALNRLREARVVMRNGMTANIVTLANTYDRLGNVCHVFATSFVYEGRGGCGLDTPTGSGGTGTVGPHRVRQITTGSGAVIDYYYDIRGNQTVRDNPGTAQDRTIRYSFDDKAHEIDLGGAKTRFWYGSDGQRYKREHGGKRTLYLGNVEIETVGGATTIKRTVAGVMLQTVVGSTATNHYLFHDHLGSLARTTNASGSPIDSLDYRHFGHRRSYTDPAAAIETGPSLTARGFTGHEHVDATAMQVIHMNGRIYDPALHRFLQADPVIQAPGNLQSWNAYTYVFNNPLAYTDPTGMFGVLAWKHNKRKELGRSFMRMIGPEATAIIGGIACAFTGPYAAACNAVGNYEMTRAFGGSASDARRAGVRAAFASGVMQAVGSYDWQTNTGRVFATAMAGGIIAEVSGGSFGNGFASAGVTAMVMPHVGNIDSRGGRIVMGAIVGGTASSMTGGKFANGAMSGAMQAAMMGARTAFTDVDGGWGNEAPGAPEEISNMLKSSDPETRLAGLRALARHKNLHLSDDQIQYRNHSGPLSRFGRAAAEMKDGVIVFYKNAFKNNYWIMSSQMDHEYAHWLDWSNNHPSISDSSSLWAEVRAYTYQLRAADFQKAPVDWRLGTIRNMHAYRNAFMLERGMQCRSMEIC